MLCIRLMGGCNNNCLHCLVFEEIKKEKYPSLDTIKKDIEKHITDRENVDGIDIFGGEPTIYPEFYELLCWLKEKGIKCRLASNMRAFYYKDFSKKVADLGVISEIRASLYGSDEKVHEMITGVKGSFKQTIAGIQNCLNDGIDVLVNVVIMKPNYDKLKEITEFVGLMGIKTIKFSSLIMWTKAKENKETLAISMKDVGPKIREAIKYSLEKGINVRIEKSPLCLAPEYENIFIKENDEQASIDKMFTKLKICSDCKKKHSCVGVSVGYNDLFGSEGIEPIKK